MISLFPGNYVNKDSMDRAVELVDYLSSAESNRLSEGFDMLHGEDE